ncbi:hypothetical protein [Streptomyces pilosus]|uniref:hypothetical protein n=1 Tax=Streptomyces pilosus TaxID=28893 RepID=UPI003643DE60
MNFDAGHNHLPAPGFVTGCPLCDAAKTARNQAIAHLSEALHLLSLIQPADPTEDPRPVIRLNLAPIGITGDDVDNCHSVDLTAKQAEALADGVDSMHAYAAGGTIPQPAETGELREQVGSGEWSAAAVAQNNPDLYADVTDLFLLIDPREITASVLDHRQVDMVRAVEALDDWFGEIADPYADEDDA